MQIFQQRKKQNSPWLWLLLFIPISFGTAVYFILRRKAQMRKRQMPDVNWNYSPLPTQEVAREEKPSSFIAVNKENQQKVKPKYTPVRPSADQAPKNQEEQAEAVLDKHQRIKEINANNLTEIKGITPVVAHVLMDSNISTFDVLANTPRGRLEEILRYVEPEDFSYWDTWEYQAQLASEGRWDDLQDFQRSLPIREPKRA